jgi:hypothetical protein
VRRESAWVYCSCPRLGSGEARSCPLSGRSLDLNCAHQAFAACANGGYQPSLGVLGVPLIMVPDKNVTLFILNQTLETNWVKLVEPVSIVVQPVCTS